MSYKDVFRLSVPIAFVAAHIVGIKDAVANFSAQKLAEEEAARARRIAALIAQTDCTVTVIDMEGARSSYRTPVAATSVDGFVTLARPVLQQDEDGSWRVVHPKGPDAVTLFSATEPELVGACGE